MRSGLSAQEGISSFALSPNTTLVGTEMKKQAVLVFVARQGYVATNMALHKNTSSEREGGEKVAEKGKKKK